MRIDKGGVSVDKGGVSIDKPYIYSRVFNQAAQQSQNPYLQEVLILSPNYVHGCTFLNPLST